MRILSANKRKRKIVIIVIVFLLVLYLFRPSGEFWFVRRDAWKAQELDCTFYTEKNGIVTSRKGYMILDGKRYDFDVTTDAHLHRIQFDNQNSDDELWLVSAYARDVFFGCSVKLDIHQVEGNVFPTEIKQLTLKPIKAEVATNPVIDF